MNIRKQFFTLIELLVVVAIIGILVSILMPSLGRAREKVKRSLCLSNLSQTGRGMAVFSKAFDGHIPIGTWTSYRGNYFMVPNTSYWYSMLGTLYATDVISGKGVYFCPTKNNADKYAFEPGDTFIRSDYVTRPFIGNKDYVWKDFYLTPDNPARKYEIALTKAPRLTNFDGNEVVVAEQLSHWGVVKKLHLGDGMNILRVDGSGSWNQLGGWADPIRPTLSGSDLTNSLLKQFWENMDDL